MIHFARRGSIAVAAVLCLSWQTAACAENFTIRRIAPRYMDAEQLVAMLWGPADVRGGGADLMQELATDMVYRAARQRVSGTGRWAQDTRARSYPAESGGGLSGMVPRGILGRPLVVPEQNVLMVKGTLAALEELEEVIAMVDRPTDMVNVDVQSVDLPQEELEGWGLDWEWTRGDMDAGSRGNMMATGPQIRYTWQNTRVALNMLDKSSRGRHVQGAHVTTLNNAPAIVVFGENLPFVVATTEYDQYGYRRRTVDEVNAIFIGTELWVRPRINGDGTVTMQLEPALSEWIGEVSVPGSSPIPITRHATVSTTVTVADGESMVIGGLSRDTESINEKFRGLFSRHRHRLTSHPVLVVTPTIIRSRNLGM
jgi:type II secretory pathway component GspD/PulD (secretin)